MSKQAMHELRCHPQFYQQIVNGEKTFELRKDDRGFRVGHTLHLREWDPSTGRYTGRAKMMHVSHILRADDIEHVAPGALGKGYCIMSLEPRL